MPANNGRVLLSPRASEPLLLSFPTQLTFSPSSSTPYTRFNPPYHRLDLNFPLPSPSQPFLSVPNTQRCLPSSPSSPRSPSWPLPSPPSPLPRLARVSLFPLSPSFGAGISGQPRLNDASILELGERDEKDWSVLEGCTYQTTRVHQLTFFLALPPFAPFSPRRRPLALSQPAPSPPATSTTSLARRSLPLLLLPSARPRPSAVRPE